MKKKATELRQLTKIPEDPERKTVAHDRKEVAAQMLKWVKEGYTKSEIFELLEEEYQYRKLTVKQAVWTFMSKALTINKLEDMQEAVNLLEAQYMDLYRTARLRNDLTTARQILSDISRMKGLLEERYKIQTEIKIEF